MNRNNLGGLSVGNIDTNVAQTWPTNTFLTYILQSSTNLMSADWVNVTNTPITTNGTFQLTVPLSASADFYRLAL
jgi:hypothetical protein